MKLWISHINREGDVKSGIRHGDLAPTWGGWGVKQSFRRVGGANKLWGAGCRVLGRISDFGIVISEVGLLYKTYF